MRSSLLFQVTLFAFIFIIAFADDTNCIDDYKASAFDCQFFLDRWYFDDNATYNVYSNCTWTAATRLPTTACKLLENDSCTLVISGTRFTKYSGKDIKEFVQKALNNCNHDGQGSGQYIADDISKGALCLCNNANASSCF